MWCEATNEEQHLGFEEQLSVDESFKYTNLSCANMEVRYISLGCLVVPMMKIWSGLYDKYLQVHEGFLHI